MRHLIQSSNERVKVALLVVRVHRDGGTMAELRDALAQRRAMRDKAKFSLWFMANEERLLETFNRRLVRRELDHYTGNIERDFNTFIRSQLAQENLA